MKRALLCTFCLVLILVPQAALAKTQIVWTEWDRPNQAQVVELILDSFHKQNPDIEVIYQPMTSEDQVTVAMAGGVAPDVIGFWGDGLLGWMEQGALLNLDPYLAEHGFDWEDFNPMQLAAFSSRGSQYILPHYLGTTVVMLNVDHFEEAGIPLPDSDWTWDDRREIGRKLSKEQDGNVLRWGNLLVLELDRFPNLISAYGGVHHPEGDNSVILWDRPEAIEALETWRTMVFDDRSAPTVEQLAVTGDYRANFAAERGSTMEALAIDLAHWAHVNFEMATVQNPAGPAKRVSLATLDGYGVWARTEHPEAAVKFLLHLVSPEANIIRARLQGMQPARQSTLPDWVELTLEAYPLLSRDGLMEFAIAGQYAEPPPSFSDPATYVRVMTEAMNRIFSQNEPASIVMSEVVPALNAALQR